MRGIGSLALRYSTLNNSNNALKPTHFKSFSTFAPSGSGSSGDNNNTSTFETGDEFEQRIFGGPSSGSFFQKLDRLEKARNRRGPPRDEQGMTMMDGLDETFSTLSDGMDAKLKKAAANINLHPQQFSKNDYSFRPENTTSWPTPLGQPYSTREPDPRNPGVRRPRPRKEFKVTTEEVLRKADFRNVRFLANFITEAGIIIKRSKTGISAKAQRKVAREIKTARAFGLMPFTTMGTKPFAFGRNMEPCDEDYEYTMSDGWMAAQANGRDPVPEHKFVV